MVFLRFLVQPVSEFVKFLDVHMFPCLYNVWVITTDPFDHLALQVMYTMALLVEVFT